MQPASKPRILMISSRRIPMPLSAGFAIRMFNTAKALSESYELDLLCLDQGGAQEVDVRAFEGVFRRVYSFSYPTAHYLLNAMGGLFSADPIQVRTFQFEAVRRWIRERQHAYAAVVATHVRVAELVKELEIPVILDLVDAISLNYQRAVETARGPWRMLYHLEKDRLLRYEVEAVNRFPCSWVVSEVDRQHLLAHGADPDRLATVPVGVQEHVVRRAAYQGPEENAVVFLGKMSYHPNRDAALFFAREIFPRLREAVPDLTFYVVGGDPPREVKALASIPGIVVTGFVEDPYQYLERAKAVVAPIRFGAGIQNKVLEGMALRRPVITSSVGAAGIAGVPGRDLLVADEPRAVTEAVLRCLGDGELRRQIGAHGRRLIEQQFTWSSIGLRLRRSVETLLSPRALEAWI